MTEQEKKYIEIIDTIVIALDNKGEITFLNKKGYEILGYKEGELIGKNWFETFIPNNIKTDVYDVYKKLMKGDIEPVKYYENPIITKNGQEKIIYWKNTFLSDDEGNIIGILSSGEDITERKKNEENIEKISRSYKMLSESNLLLTTVDSEIELYQKFCTTIVETGGYRAAWIGEVQHDKEKSVLPVAHAGFEKRYLDSFKVSWADAKRGQGSTGKCIRTKTYHIVTGLLKDPNFIHWREIAKIYNVDSSIALPIIIENVVIASLCIYWVEDYTLDQEEIDLLSDMVTNLSLTIEKKRYLKITQDKINQEREYFISILSGFADGVYIVNENYDIQYVNPILIEDFGSWEGKKCYAYFHNRQSSCPWCKNHRVFRGESVQWEWYSAKVNKTYDLLDTLLINPDGTKSKLEVFRDISERKINEQKLKESEERYHNLIDNLMEMLIVVDNDGEILYVNSRSFDLLGYQPEELIGKNLVPKIVNIEDFPFSHIEIEDYEQTLGQRFIEHKMKHKDGHSIMISGKMVTRMNKGKIEHVGLLRDITRQKEAEDLLRIKNFAIESSSNPIIMVDSNHILTYVNPAWLKMWGYAHTEEVLGKSIKNYIHVKTEHAFKKKSKKLEETRKATHEIIGKKKDGTIFHALLSISTVYDEQKKPIQRMASFIDITDRIKAEKLKVKFNKQLEEKVTEKTLELLKEITERKIIEDKLRSVQNKLKYQIKQLHCLYGISHILSLTDVSIEKILQSTLYLIPPTYTFPTLINVKIRYYNDEYKLDLFKETKWKLSVMKYIKKKPLVIDVFYNEDKEFLVEEKNLLNEIGERLKIGILRREIDQEKNILAEMVKNSPDAIFTMNNDTIITSWNKGAENIYGYTHNEIIGESIDHLVPTNKINAVLKISKKIIPGIKVDHFETKGLNKNGKILDISVTVSPIKNQEGDLVGSFSIARDFTETNEQQKLYQEQLLKSSQFKSEFMASMSHELRTPLNSIIGFTDVILERISGELNEEQDKYLTNVKTSALHLLDLINDVLDIAKIESGKMEMNIEDVNLGIILSQINTMIKPIYEKKNLKFEIPKFDKDKVIRVDRLRFKEILFNLLSNAVKYTIEGGIKLEFSEDDHDWKFNVIDTGIGIKEEDYPLIFMDFKRIQSAQVNKIEGTGLGLSLTKRLIEYHGGNISFTSTFGKGSTFTFTIPK